MQILRFYDFNVIKYDLLTKFNFVNSFEIPFLKRIVLRFNISQASLKTLLPSLAGLFIIASQKPFLSVKKKISITVKLKAGLVVSCKVDLRNECIYVFLDKFVFFLLPNMRDFNYYISNNNVFFTVDNVFLFKEIEKEFEYFQELPKLNIILSFRGRNNFQQVQSFLTALKFPL